MEESKEQTIKRLQEQVVVLQKRVGYLEKLLDEAHISYDKDCNESREDANNAVSDQNLKESQKNQGSRIISETITKDHAKFFYSMFKGRTDVYSKRAAKPNAKTGKTGYYTQCWNFWKDGLCPKKRGVQIKCADCANQRYKQLTGDDLMNHLIGAKEDCSDVIGIYPMLSNETCNFLVFDFDNHESDNQLDDDANTGNDWVEEVNSMRMICAQNDVDVLVERSRSGKGAHIWLFFEEPVPAATARKFGDALLTKGAESVNQKTFQSYDRMLPAQDHMPAGGLGNLIALPLQGRALREGNSAFIDENWNAYPNQWKQLQTVKKLSKAFVEEQIKEWNQNSTLNFFAGDLSGDAETSEKDGEKDKSKPWERKEKRFDTADVDGVLKITRANQIFTDCTNVKPRMQNQLRRLAAYSNPQFYKNQAMGFSVRGTPRIISCSSDIDQYICLPRGCEETLVHMAEQSGISYTIQDCRQGGRAIHVSFQGALYPEQKRAAEKMLAHDNGVLHAATAFGKTAVGAYLVAERKVNTLVLVHNMEIMKNWVEDFEKFLLIKEKLLQIKEEERFREEKNVQLKKMANDVVPFIIVKELLEKLSVQLSKEHDKQQYNLLQQSLNNILPDVIHKVSKRLELENDTKFTDLVIEEFNNEVQAKKICEVVDIINLSGEEYIAMKSAISRYLALDKEKVVGLEQEIKDSIEKVQRLRQEMEDCTVEGAQEYLENKTALISKTNELANQLQYYIENLQHGKKILEEKISVFKREEKKFNEVSKNSSISELSEKSVVFLDVLQKRLFRNEIKKVEELFMGKIKELSRKNRFIDSIMIDTDFNVHIYKKLSFNTKSVCNRIKKMGAQAYWSEYGTIHCQGLLSNSNVKDLNEFVNFYNTRNEKIVVLQEIEKSRLSKGERQVFIMALYWSFMKMNKQEVPFVIDTPFARIDTEHRVNITKKFFMDLSGQVFIFSTNEEIVGEHFEKMKGCVQAKFLLENSDNLQTIVHANEYFGG